MHRLSVILFFGTITALLATIVVVACEVSANPRF